MTTIDASTDRAVATLADLLADLRGPGGAAHAAAASLSQAEALAVVEHAVEEIRVPAQVIPGLWKTFLVHFQAA